MGAVGISGESPRDTLERLERLEHMEGYFINVSGTSEYFLCRKEGHSRSGGHRRRYFTGEQGIYSMKLGPRDRSIHRCFRDLEFF